MRIKVYRNGFGMAQCLVFYYHANGKNFAAKPVKLEFEEVRQAAVIEPTMIVDDFEADSLFQDMADIAEEHGKKSAKSLQTEVKEAGKLEATQEHLKDMRKIVAKVIKVDL